MIFLRTVNWCLYGVWYGRHEIEAITSLFLNLLLDYGFGEAPWYIDTITFWEMQSEFISQTHLKILFSFQDKQSDIKQDVFYKVISE